MDFNVEKTLYQLTWKNFNLEVSVVHGEQMLDVLFMINNTVVVERKISRQEAGDLSDADIIHVVEDKYIAEKQSLDKYSDIIVNHSHEMKIIKKQVTYSREKFGVKFFITIDITDGNYHFVLTNDTTQDRLEGDFVAKDVSEVLEKFRIYLSGGIEISQAASEYLDRLVNQHPLIR